MKKTLFTLFAALLLFASCSKDSDPQPVQEVWNYTIARTTTGSTAITTVVVTSDSQTLSASNVYLDVNPKVLGSTVTYSGKTATLRIATKIGAVPAVTGFKFHFIQNDKFDHIVEVPI